MKTGVYAAILLLLGGGAHLCLDGACARAGGFAAERARTLAVAAGFRVDNILVTGRRRVTQEELLKRLDIARGAPVFSVDLARARENVAGIPWVKSATVARRLPDTIRVDITERAPVALWQYARKIRVVDAEGAVLASENLGAYKDLPLVVGARAGEHAGALLALLALEPSVAAQVSSAVRIGGRRWDLHMKNGMVVKLPEADTELALARLARLEAEKNIFSRALASIDLRLPGLTVAARGAAEAGEKENI